MKKKVNVFWFRRDLRLVDNRSLYMALKSGLPVLPVFIFDTDILNRLPYPSDARVNFIHSCISEIKSELEKKGSSIKIFHSRATGAFKNLALEFDIETVFAGKDFEPKAMQRDKEVETFLRSQNIEFKLFTDHVVFEPGVVVKDNGEPYTVFTPYSKKWRQHLSEIQIQYFPSEKELDNCMKTVPFSMPALVELGFVPGDISIPPKIFQDKIISEYAGNRDIPSLPGTSRLGVHLRFGTISIRELTVLAARLSEVFLNELIWRNFFIDILYHYPHVETNSFKPKYDFIPWRNNEKEFELWCRGETGYPMVDAGMRELNVTGFMHNRVRMVAASFLVKHLLIDWRWGEAYFAEKLLDFELASNNGNWQWAAGCGCDAAPYFRVFNPESQQKKFDPKSEYILKWVPGYGTLSYPKPIVDHKFARDRVIKKYKEALTR